MSDRLFYLLERHQRLDELLRRAQSKRFADPFEIMRLQRLKRAIRNRLARIARRPVPAI
jgi:hypothetical protein